MRIHSIDLISRTTRASHRALLIFAIGIIAFERYDLRTKDWEPLGLSISEQAYFEISLAVLLYLTVAHILQWVSDWQSYTKWFAKGKAFVARYDGDAETDIIDALLEELSNFSEYADSPEDRLDFSGSIAQKLKNIAPNFRSISWLARFHIYVWYLVFPVVIAAIALFSLIF